MPRTKCIAATRGVRFSLIWTSLAWRTPSIHARNVTPCSACNAVGQRTQSLPAKKQQRENSLRQKSSSCLSWQGDRVGDDVVAAG